MPSLFVAVGHDGLRVTSADGQAWSAPVLGKEGETYRAAAGGNGRLVAVGGFGGSNIFAATADGLNWKTAQQDAGFVRYIRGLAFGGDTFLGLGGDPGSVGAAKPFVMISRDGETWDGPHDIPGKFMLRRAAWGNGVWVGVGDRGRRSHSPDGRTWHDLPDVKPLDTLTDVAFGNGVFVGVGLHGFRTRTEDGKAWDGPTRGDEGEHLNAVVWAGDRFVAVGPTVTYTSADGRQWGRHPVSNGPLSAAYGNGAFIGVRWRGRLLRSADGIVWDEAHRVDHPIEAVAFGEVG